MVIAIGSMYSLKIKRWFTSIHNPTWVSVFSLCLLFNISRASDLQLNPQGIPESLRNILTTDLATFEAPLWMQKEYPYFLSGFDQYNRPIWIIDMGKWDARKMVRKGGKDFELFDRYVNQCVYRILASRMRNSTFSSPSNSNSNTTTSKMQSNSSVTPNELIMIYDFKTVSISQVNSVRTVKWATAKLRTLLDAALPMKVGYALNMNFVGEKVFKILKPIIGEMFSKIEVFGTGSAKWIPTLQNLLPRDQIPHEFGGFQNFTPAFVFG